MTVALWPLHEPSDQGTLDTPGSRSWSSISRSSSIWRNRWRISGPRGTPHRRSISNRYEFRSRVMGRSWGRYSTQLSGRFAEAFERRVHEIYRASE